MQRNEGRSGFGLEGIGEFEPTSRAKSVLGQSRNYSVRWSAWEKNRVL